MPAAGRWPANIILSPESAAALDEMSGESRSHGTTGHWGSATGEKRQGNAYGVWTPTTRESAKPGHLDTGGASRFFYCAKASRSERERGLEGLPLRDGGCLEGNADTQNARKIGARPDVPVQKSRNNHPCVKPLSLCEYLARLIVPPVAYRDDARLLVPFCGSGSEMIGAYRAGWLHVDGIDNDAGYIEIARLRIAADMPLFAEAA